MDHLQAAQEVLAQIDVSRAEQAGGGGGGLFGGSKGQASKDDDWWSKESKGTTFKKSEPSECVYMVGLPQDSTEGSVKGVFSQYGTVNSVKILPIKPGTDSSAALVRMGSLQQAQWLVDNIHGEVPKGLDHVVTIRFANAKGQGKGKEREPFDVRGHAGQMSLNVSGCSSPDVSDIIKGTYQVSEHNHNKSVYKKEATDASGPVVLIYYWDERDGPNFHGWWFGPKIGGDQVWAYNGDKGSPNPPGQGWKVPWNGDVDPSLKVTVTPGSGAQALFYSMINNPYADWAAGNSSAGPVKTEKSEVIKQRMAALKEKRQQEESIRQEQATALVVRKVIQKLRVARPEAVDEVRKELEEVQTQNLEKMGSQAEKVMQEAEKAMKQAQERVDEENMKKMKEEQKRLEEEIRAKEEAFRIENTTKEAKEEVVQAEAQVAQASALGEPMAKESEEDAASPEGIYQAVQAMEEALASAQATMDKVSASLMLKKAELGVTKQAVDALKSEFKPLFARLAECRRTSAGLAKKVTDAKDKAAVKEKAFQEKKAREAAAAKKEEEQKAAFAKFDTDKDGKLSKEEIVAFAKAEYEFAPSDEQLEKWTTGFGAEDGVEYASFARLRSAVGVARSEARAREKRLEEEAKEKEMAEKRAGLNKRVADLLESVSEVDNLIAKVVASAAALADMGEADKLLEAASETEASLQEPGDASSGIMSRVEALEAEDPINDDAKVFVQKETLKVRSWASALQGKLDKAAADVEAARGRAGQLATEALERLRLETVACIRDYMDAEKKTEEDIFAEVCAGAAEVPADKLASFASSLPSAPRFKDGEAMELFQHVLEREGCEAIGKAVFTKFVRLFYQVVKTTVLTDALSIQGNVHRKLEVGEILERTHGSAQEESAGVQRVQCRATKDGQEGWATLCGNQGSAFLKPISPLVGEVKALLDGAGSSTMKTAEE